MWQQIVLAWKQRNPQQEAERVTLQEGLGDAELEPTQGSDSAPRVSGRERWRWGSGGIRVVSLLGNGGGGYTLCMFEPLLTSGNPGGQCCGLSCFTDEKTESQGHTHTTPTGHESLL